MGSAPSPDSDRRRDHRADCAPLTAKATGFEATADMIRETPRSEEARCDLFFAGCPARDRNAQAPAGAATCSIVTKQRDATMNTEKPQQPRRKSDLRFFVLFVGITAPAHLRRRASAQPAVNSTEQPRKRAMSQAVELPHTLHPFHRELHVKDVSRGAVRCSRVLYRPSNLATCQRVLAKAIRLK